MRRCALVKQGALMLMLIIVIESERSDVALHARESAITETTVARHSAGKDARRFSLSVR